jgi:hypothetical protein
MAQLSQQREMFFYKEKKSTCSNANGNDAKKGKKINRLAQDGLIFKHPKIL